MVWSTLTFGKHKGKSLPQVIFSDPDWFFWGIEDKVFQGKGSIEVEAKDLYRKARAICIPGSEKKKLVAVYFIHPMVNRFDRLEIVPADQPLHEGGSRTMRKSVIDLSVPRQLADYDKLGCSMLLADAKKILFGPITRVSKQRCEGFFIKKANFVGPRI